MKRHKNLYGDICTFSNLLLAVKKAQKGKRFQENVARFNFKLESNLFELQKELTTQSYQPGAYKEFHIKEPKPRMISAAPYRDRVVHHALCNLIAPILENSMIYDSYANRKGKGTHKAIERFQKYAKKNTYVLKCDVKKYFPSIDHQILKEQLRKKIGCKKTLWLIDTIIDNSNNQITLYDYFPNDDLFSISERRKGLPIGNLTSQLFGNYYLNALDHYLKEDLGCKCYVRYVDDFVILDNDKEKLKERLESIQNYLLNFRLSLHSNKSRIHKLTEGIPFLGHRIYPNYRTLKTENVRRFRKRLKWMLKEYHAKKMPLKKFNDRVRSWLVHASFSKTYYLRKKIFIDIYKK